jgi:spectinomycin phosphotransferase
MLEKPDLQDGKIVACLQDKYGLNVVQVAFLPLGADLNTAVYRVVTEDTASCFENGTQMTQMNADRRCPFSCLMVPPRGHVDYFVKLRGGVFDETSVALPKFLSDQGIEQIIPPLTTQTGQLWADLAPFKVILYPFVEGRNGYEVDLSDRHWNEFGTALKHIHTAQVPTTLTRHIRQETYSPQGREIVKTFLERIEQESYDDTVAISLAAYLKLKRAEILDLVGRAECLAQALQAQSPDFVVCHSDIHAGNVLIGADGAFYIVDWDEPILAPKERDLMYVGGGLMGNGRTPEEEETLFYRAYGQTQIDPISLAYYRYERIVQDIAVYCQQLLLTNEGGEDREQSLFYLRSNFLPNSTIEIAYRSDKTAGEKYATQRANLTF